MFFWESQDIAMHVKYISLGRFQKQSHISSDNSATRLVILHKLHLIWPPFYLKRLLQNTIKENHVHGGREFGADFPLRPKPRCTSRGGCNDAGWRININSHKYIVDKRHKYSNMYDDRHRLLSASRSDLQNKMKWVFETTLHIPELQFLGKIISSPLSDFAKPGLTFHAEAWLISHVPPSSKSEISQNHLATRTVHYKTSPHSKQLPGSLCNSAQKDIVPPTLLGGKNLAKAPTFSF